MRRKTRRRLTLLVVLVVLVPLAFKGWLYLRVKLAVDDFIARVADRAQVEYQGIETDFRGAASVLGVRIRPATLSAPVVIERVRLATDDLWYFLDPRPSFDDADARRPDQLRLQAFGISLPLNDQVIAALRPQDASASGDGCDELSFAPAMLKALGMSRLLADMEGLYRFDRANERLRLETTIAIQGVETIHMGMELAGIVPEDLELGRATRAKLAAAELAVEIEPDFGQRLVTHCAALGQQSPEAYLASMIERSHRRLAETGIELGPALQKALDEFNRHWGRVDLRLRPPEPLAILQLLAISPDRLVSALGMTLAINGHPVTPLDVRINPSRIGSGLPGVAPGIARKDESKMPRRYLIRREFVPVATDRLRGLVGRRVRITQRGEPIREGLLVEIANGRAVVEQRRPGGKVAAYVPLDQIVAVEVEAVRRIPQP
ncbi:MAG: hypothetical protein D6720_06925 [Gammaproteobacteria bacterium]|nr:MAG: hypothetical protein D6720_06925 [Gammaproteobacteria bacterium]